MNPMEERRAQAGRLRLMEWLFPELVTYGVYPYVLTGEAGTKLTLEKALADAVGSPDLLTRVEQLALIREYCLDGCEETMANSTRAVVAIEKLRASGKVIELLKQFLILSPEQMWRRNQETQKLATSYLQASAVPTPPVEPELDPALLAAIREVAHQNQVSFIANILEAAGILTADQFMQRVNELGWRAGVGTKTTQTLAKVVELLREGQQAPVR